MTLFIELKLTAKIVFLIFIFFHKNKIINFFIINHESNKTIDKRNFNIIIYLLSNYIALFLIDYNK